MADTIYALASAPGRAGISVLRVSGPQAGDSLLRLTGAAALPPPRQAMHWALRNPDGGQPVDQALVLYFKGPSSYTGEDVVEYHLHGSPAIVRNLLQILAQQKNHRLAEPGEFTRRAFEHGKMDLTAAEAIADLINAETEYQQQQALSQMSGALAGLYEDWRKSLSRALAHLEADIDFPDEDLPHGVAAQVLPVLRQISLSIADHLNDNRRGERLRDGLQIAVIGAPNAGKSSLVNALAERDIAIVSEHAGTTRDVIEAHLNLGGYPVILADTAGLRPDQLGHDAQASIESEGIRRAIDRAAKADIKLLVFDATLPGPDRHTLALHDDSALLVLNKCDLAAAPPGWAAGAVAISTKTAQGLDTLTAAIIAKIDALLGQRSNTPSLTRQRHRNALEDCLASLSRAEAAALPELMAEDVRMAMRALGRITGRVDVEDLLDIIFRDFCIGK